ncbi:MAG: hypothetical protein Q7U04_08740 [Bacteriovorax sp.]|nr:hypothetical protein [Bacteriovorax sp.]
MKFILKNIYMVAILSVILVASIFEDHVLAGWYCHSPPLMCLGNYGSLATCTSDNGAGMCNSTGPTCVALCAAY